MLFKPMDATLARKLVEGFQNELEPQRKALEAYYRQCRCPKCKGECRKEFVSGHSFDASGETLVPRSCLRCSTCSCLFDPHTNLVLEMGDVPIR